MSETKNALVKSTILGREDHGIPTAIVFVGGEGWSQSFGGYDLRHPARSDFCQRVLDAVGVSTWEKLPGTVVRIRGTHTKIEAIGHAIEDRWYEPWAER